MSLSMFTYPLPLNKHTVREKVLPANSPSVQKVLVLQHANKVYLDRFLTGQRYRFHWVRTELEL